MFCGFALLLEIRRVLGPEFLLVHEPAVQVLPDHGLGPVFVPVPDGFQDQCMIRKGCPVGLGEPEFGKLHAALGAAMLSINAVKGFEYGEGFAGVTARGSEQNDVFISAGTDDDQRNITTLTNHSGGIQGGISNGQDIYFRVAFKPVATLLREQDTVDMEGNPTKLTARGRHDPCVLPRAVPVVEAMAAMVILDHFLLNKGVKL